jgi:hypothetical protein
VYVELFTIRMKEERLLRESLLKEIVFCACAPQTTFRTSSSRSASYHHRPGSLLCLVLDNLFKKWASRGRQSQSMAMRPEHEDPVDNPRKTESVVLWEVISWEKSSQRAVTYRSGSPPRTPGRYQSQVPEALHPDFSGGSPGVCTKDAEGHLPD